MAESSIACSCCSSWVRIAVNLSACASSGAEEPDEPGPFLRLGIESDLGKGGPARFDEDGVTEPLAEGLGMRRLTDIDESLCGCLERLCSDALGSGFAAKPEMSLSTANWSGTAIDASESGSLTGESWFDAKGRRVLFLPQKASSNNSSMNSSDVTPSLGSPMDKI